MRITTKIGVIVVVIAALFGGVLFNLIGTTKQEAATSECYQKKECAQAASALNATNIGIGLLFGLFFLGLYLIIFAHGEPALFRHLEREKSYLKAEEKLKIIHMLLDENERKVFDAITHEDGVSQQMLRYRTDLSKSMISEILSRFERRDLITRVPAGKTYSIFVKRPIQTL